MSQSKFYAINQMMASKPYETFIDHPTASNWVPEIRKPRIVTRSQWLTRRRPAGESIARVDRVLRVNVEWECEWFGFHLRVRDLHDYSASPKTTKYKMELLSPPLRLYSGPRRRINWKNKAEATFALPLSYARLDNIIVPQPPKIFHCSFRNKEPEDNKETLVPGTVFAFMFTKRIEQEKIFTLDFADVDKDLDNIEEEFAFVQPRVILEHPRKRKLMDEPEQPITEHEWEKYIY